MKKLNFPWLWTPKAEKMGGCDTPPRHPPSRRPWLSGVCVNEVGYLVPWYELVLMLFEVYYSIEYNILDTKIWKYFCIKNVTFNRVEFQPK